MKKRCKRRWMYQLVAGIVSLVMGGEAFAASTVMIDMKEKVNELDLVQATVTGEPVLAAKEVEWQTDPWPTTLLWHPNMGPKTGSTRLLQFFHRSGSAYTNAYSLTMSATLRDGGGTAFAKANREITICPVYFRSPSLPGWTRKGWRSVEMARKPVEQTTKNGYREVSALVFVQINTFDGDREELRKAVERSGREGGNRSFYGEGIPEVSPYSRFGFSGFRVRSAKARLFTSGSYGPTYGYSSIAMIVKGESLIRIETSVSGTGVRKYAGPGYTIIYDDAPWLKANGELAQQEADAIVDGLVMDYATQGGVPNLERTKDVGDPPVINVSDPGTGDAEALWQEAKKAYESGDLLTAEVKATESVKLLSKPERDAFVAKLKQANQLWKEGQTLEAQGKLKEALAKYKESVKYAASKERLKIIEELQKRLYGALPDVSGKWDSYQQGKKVADCAVQQDGDALTYTIDLRNPVTYFGQFVDASTVKLRDGDRVVTGVIRDDATRIVWNDSEWVRPGNVPKDGNNTGGGGGGGGNSGGGANPPPPDEMAWVLVDVKDKPGEGSKGKYWEDIYTYGREDERVTIKGKEGELLEGRIRWVSPPKWFLPEQPVALTFTIDASGTKPVPLGGVRFVCTFDAPGLDAGRATSSRRDLIDENGKCDLYIGLTPGTKVVSGKLPRPSATTRKSLYVQVGNMVTEYVYEYRQPSATNTQSSSPGTTSSTGGAGPQTESGTVKNKGGGGTVISGQQDQKPLVDPIPEGPGGSSGMTLLAEKRTGRTGDTVMIPVVLSCGQGVANMNVIVTYDSSVARAEGKIVRGNLIDANTSFEANPQEAGVARVGFARSGDLKNFDGTVANIPFRITGKPGDRTALKVVVDNINGADGNKPSIVTIDGEIEVLGEKGGKQGSTTGSEELTPADALNALKMSVHLIPVDLRADMNGDGSVKSEDARLILQQVVGKQGSKTNEPIL